MDALVFFGMLAAVVYATVRIRRRTRRQVRFYESN